MMYKGTALPFVVMGVVLVTGLMYLFLNFFLQKTPAVSQAQPMPTPDQYSNWSVYKNPKYGFSVKYPEDWTIKEYESYSVEFFPKESTGGALVRFSVSSDQVDLKEFEKIYKLDEGSQFAEPLDVHSQVTKIQNSQLSNYQSIEYYVDRAFSALEGPKGEYSHFFSVNKNGSIIKFVSKSTSREEQLRLYDGTFESIINSISFD